MPEKADAAEPERLDLRSHDHSVAGGVLLVCLDQDLTLEAIRGMAERKPERVVCLDAGFAGNDQLKANAVQIFKTKDVKSFRTV
jgi:adenine-specific DNA-methyltransferase